MRSDGHKRTKFHDNPAFFAEQLDQAAKLAWPPEEIAVISGWQVTASRDITKRTNIAGVWQFDDTIEIGTAITAVESWYRDRGKPSLFQLTPWARPAALDKALESRGYRRFDDSLVQVRPIASAATPLPFDGCTTEIELRATALAMNALCDPRMRAEARTARAALLGRIRRPMAIAVAMIGSEPVGGGLIVVDGPLAGIFAMRTHAPWQRRGIASMLLGRLFSWAGAMGAERAYLQVEEANQAARRLYARFGFQTVYGYHYRQAPD